MIRQRLLVASMLVSAAGWQFVSGMDGDRNPMGLLLVAVAAMGIAAAVPREWRIGTALGALAVQFAALAPLTALFARWHTIPGSELAIAFVARLTGVEAAASGGRVVIQSGGPVVELLPTPARLGAFLASMALVGAAAAIAVLPFRASARFFARLIAALVGWMLFRIVFLVVARVDLPEHGLESSAILVLLSMLPAIAFVSRNGELAEVERVRGALRPLVAAVAGAAWIIAFAWIDVGTPGRGRVLFDDSHGPWEPTDTPYGPTDYGQRNAYAYSSLFKLTGWHYDVRRHVGAAITDDVLRDVDVLVLKTPTETIAASEVNAVERFVRTGGGLLLIGDHTNLFGMTTHLNRVARRFGFAFNADDTFALRTEAQSRWSAPRLAPHPIAASIGSFEFETSCTLDVPFAARASMIGYGLGADDADYSRPGFFGNLHLDDHDRSGFFVQHAVADHGKGRVAVISDSTPLSNFSLFFPGRRELALATIEFLNRDPSGARYIPLIALLLAIAGASWLVTTGGRSRALPVALALAIGIVAGFAIVRTTSASLDVPRPRVLLRTVSFDTTIGTPVLPSVLETDDTLAPVAVDTFFVAAQRLGGMPIASSRWTSSLDARSTMVVVRPSRGPTPDELQSLHRFVRDGGSLLVVDGLINRGAGTEPLLNAFGLAVGVLPQVAEAKHVDEPASPATPPPPADGMVTIAPPAKSQRFRIARPVLSILGGDPLLVDPDGRSVYSEVRVGRGRVGVLVDAMSVSKGQLGSRFSGDPTPDQQQQAELAYFVLRRMVLREG